MRRLALLALVLDTLAGGALFVAGSAADGPSDAYVEVAGVCVEVTERDGETLAGRPVDADLCRLG